MLESTNGPPQRLERFGGSVGSKADRLTDVQSIHRVGQFQECFFAGEVVFFMAVKTAVEEFSQLVGVKGDPSQFLARLHCRIDSDGV